MSNNFNTNNRANLNPLLKWLWDLLSFFSAEEISIPADFHSQVNELQLLLRSDTSGIINSLLDFAIDSALVDYSIETENKNLNDKLNKWIYSINSDLRGYIPTGLESLAREYFRERWKGSSLLVLRTQWETVDGVNLPTKLWFVDGLNISVEDKSDTRIIGNETYSIIVDKNKTRKLPATKDELIFVQKPFSPWSSIYPIPFLIQRGIYKNLKSLELINKKGERIVSKALEYMLLMKKGTENLALKGSPEYTYSEDDLRKVKDNFSNFLSNNRVEGGTPTHVTNFDTSIEHIIPDYSKAIKQELYSPIEKRILAGLGLIEIIEGTASSRKESILNPRPFISEVERGIADFKMLLNDVLQTIVEKNSSSHPKYFNYDIKIYSTPVKAFTTEDVRNHLRSMYDRGVISKQTYIEVCGDSLYFNIEVQRREKENKDKIDEILYPPVINNQEGQGLIDIRNKKIDKVPAEKIPTDRKGPEAKNFKGGEETAIYEEAPYKEIKDLPEQVKVLPSDGQSLWMRVFNESYPKGEDYARKVAWSVVKKVYKRDGDKWVKKSRVKGSEGEWINLETSSVDDILDNIVRLQEIDLREKQIKLTDKLLGNEESK